MNPRLSVVIPTFNRRDKLIEAIESVLQQRFDSFEIIVSDNASTDGTEEAVRTRFGRLPQLRYFRNEYNLGMVANWRKAVFDLAQGEWFMLFSDDDYFVDQNYLDRAFRLIEGERDVRFVYSEGYVLQEATGLLSLIKLPFEGVVDGVDVFCSRGTVKPQDITLCNMLFRRSDAYQFEFMRNPDNLSGDTEFYLKLCLHGRVGILKGPATIYRVHGENLNETVHHSIRLNVGNLDLLVQPYLMAREIIAADRLARFRRNSRIDAAIVSTLLAALCYDKTVYRSLRKKLLASVPELLPHGIASLVFESKKLLVRSFAPLLRRHYRLTT